MSIYTINYRRCPKCNSTNSIKIQYGFPSYEAFLLHEQGEINSYIDFSRPEYYCRDCENAWVKWDITQNAYNNVESIKASVGAHSDVHSTVEIDFQSPKIKWTNLKIGDNYEKTMRAAIFENFIEQLKIINPLAWRPRYLDYSSQHGIEWTVEFIKDGKYINKYGYNKFPDNWDEFCQLISKVSDKSFG